MKTRVINVSGNVSLACQNPNTKLNITLNTNIGGCTNPNDKLVVTKNHNK